jgi:hypothetical protein
MMSGGRTLCLLLESDVEEPLHLVQWLIGLRVRCVRDVFQAASSSCQIIHRTREAEATGGPCASVVIVTERVCGLLPLKVPPLALELCLSGLQVHLPRSKAVRLLLKVGVGTY